MDPLALAGLCALLARGQDPGPLPPGLTCPPASNGLRQGASCRYRFRALDSCVVAVPTSFVARGVREDRTATAPQRKVEGSSVFSAGTPHERWGHNQPSGAPQLTVAYRDR